MSQRWSHHIWISDIESELAKFEIKLSDSDVQNANEAWMNGVNAEVFVQDLLWMRGYRYNDEASKWEKRW